MSHDPVHAVLTPPDLRRFWEITGVGEADLEVRFDGWSKLALLSDSRVFLFPRRDRDEHLLHGAAVCEVLASLGVACVPRVLGRWPAGTLSAGPFVAFERRPGIGWPELEDDAGLGETERMLRSLGGVIATWHRMDVSALPATIRRPLAFDRNPWLRGLLDPDDAERVVDDAAHLLGAMPSQASTWQATVGRVSAMTPVLVHGDVCENQLLVDEGGQVGTVLDWDTAAIGHPLHDFDFGEWGFGIFRWEAEFGHLRRAMWEAYAAGRPEVTLPGFEDVHLVFTLSELACLEERSLEGSLDDRAAGRLAVYRQAIGPATDAVPAFGRDRR